MSKTDTSRASLESFGSTLASPFADGWVLMLALGGISHINHLPRLALSYWTCVLIVVIAIAILPQTFRTNALLERIVKKI